jgi:beta-N-acetylhexosaminidase
LKEEKVKLEKCSKVLNNSSNNCMVFSKLFQQNKLENLFYPLSFRKVNNTRALLIKKTFIKRTNNLIAEQIKLMITLAFLILFYTNCDSKINPNSSDLGSAILPSSQLNISGLIQDLEGSTFHSLDHDQDHSILRINQVIERSIQLMPLAQRISQLLIIQLRYDSSGLPIRRVTQEIQQVLEDLAPGGLILFGENVQTPDQLVRFIYQIHDAIPGPPAILAIDQEGGLVNRLRNPAMGATPLPSAYVMAQNGVDFAYQAGFVTGRELKSLGITMNFAPVADLSGDPATAFIGTRSFGPNPLDTGNFVSAFISGQSEGGVASVLKHFPGHGATAIDSHFEVVTFPYTKDQLLTRDLIPFIMGIESGASGVMAAHIQYPNIDLNLLPASISPVLLQELLRDTLGFERLIITDALEMQGVKQIMSSAQAAVQAILAGADMILTPFNPWPTFEALMNAVETGQLSEHRINQSLRRILRHKAQWGSGLAFQGLEYQLKHSREVLGSYEHRMLLER